MLDKSISSLQPGDSQPRVILCPGGCLVMSGDIWGCYKFGEGGGIPGICWSKARKAANIPQGNSQPTVVGWHYLSLCSQHPESFLLRRTAPSHPLGRTVMSTYPFAGAARAKPRRPGGLSHRHLLSPSSGGRNSEMKVLAGSIASEGWEGESGPHPLLVFG